MSSGSPVRPWWCSTSNRCNRRIKAPSGEQPLIFGTAVCARTTEVMLVPAAARPDILYIGALRSIKGRAFRLGFAASGGVFLLVSGWFHIPGVSGQPDVGRILQAALAIAI